MNTFNLRYTERGVSRDLSFDAIGPEAALVYAMRVAPGRWATLSDSTGEICCIQRVSEEAVWQVVRPAKAVG